LKTGWGDLLPQCASAHLGISAAAFPRLVRPGQGNVRRLYNASYFLQMLMEYGGVETARRLLVNHLTHRIA
jgi:hypothetical protein